MSSNINIPEGVNTMVCATCGMHSFAWLAEVFVCPVCGDFELGFPVSSGYKRAGIDGFGGLAVPTREEDADMEQQSRKRKGSLSDNEAD